MKNRRSKLVFNAIAFLVAGLLLYLALKDVDFGAMGQALRSANYWWLIPLIIVILLTHLLRAYRWQLQLEALPAEDGEAPTAVSLGTAYISVWLGYMVNTAVPRLGEVVRAANLAKREKLSLTAVIGSVVIERVLDLCFLAATLGISLILLLERPAIMNRYVVSPTRRLLENLSPVTVIAIVAGGIVLLLLAYLAVRKIKRHDARGEDLFSRIRAMLSKFKSGIMTLFRSERRIAIIVTSILIWVGYWIMVHLPFNLLRLVEPYGLSIADSFIVLAFGTIGFALFPSPGGTGSYHYVTIATLVYLLSMQQNDAAAYAVVNHAALSLLNVTMGMLCLAIQGSNLRELQADAEAERHILEAESDPLAP